MNHHFYPAVPPPALPNVNYPRRYQNNSLVPAVPHPHFPHPQHLPPHPQPQHQHGQPHHLHHRPSQSHILPPPQALHSHLIPITPVPPQITHIPTSNRTSSTAHPQVQLSQFQAHIQSQPQTQPLFNIPSDPEPTSPIVPHGTTIIRPPLPWLSAPEQPFPPRRSRRRRKASPAASQTPKPQQSVFPSQFHQSSSDQVASFGEPTALKPTSEKEERGITADNKFSDASSKEGAAGLTVGNEIHDVTVDEGTVDEGTNDIIPDNQANDAGSVKVIACVVPEKGTNGTPNVSASTPKTTSSTSPLCRIANPPPAVPLIPILALSVPTNPKTTIPHVAKENAKHEPIETSTEVSITTEVSISTENPSKVSSEVVSEAPASPPSAPTLAPIVKTFSSWADCVRSSSPAKGPVTVSQPNSIGSASLNKSTSLVEVLRDFNVASISNVPLPVFEPRGLINTGNMCYMNAILQILMFCGPFYSLLDLVGKQVTHNFKGDTPLIDAMVLFLREFRTLGSKSTALEKDYLEAFGDPFAPEFVYSALRQIQRFSSLRRGHQHDAEEFLGFLLDELHEETLRVSQGTKKTDVATPSVSSASEDGWLEVGPKQKVISTRATTTPDSPITKIFGGSLRSVFVVPGVKPSVIFEPYQPLQLDIQSPQVFNIIDALKQLTTPETIHGEFNSPRGPNVTATKQVFIETLPPVLILHLKRFQYDNKGGTQKIWKKIGYPLILDIPKEAISPTKRNTMIPRYRLIGVVYHHGKSASGGHYTVDVLRQDGRNWIRFDDTVIKRVHADEVKVDVKEKDTEFFVTDEEDNDGWKSVSNNGILPVINGNGNVGMGDNLYGKDEIPEFDLAYLTTTRI